MKKLFPSIAIVAIFFTACHKKAVPTVTERTPTPAATTETASTATKTTVNVAAGKTTFEAACKRCHDLPNPGAFTTTRWEGILKSMIPKARLDAAQAANVTAYVMANAKS